MFRRPAWGFLPLILALSLVVVVAWASKSGQAPPACAQNASCQPAACTGDCVAYQYFTSKSLEPWIRWYDTAWNLTGCDDPAWQVYAQWLLDIAGEVVGAPGGATLNCHQMVVGQAYVCGEHCGTNNCRYAPNVKLTTSTCGEGTVSVTVDNDAYADGLPEYESTAYSREFDLTLRLSREGGEQLLVGSQPVPSLSYSNWIINGGYDQCVIEYGSGRPCNLLAPFLKPTSLDYDLTWGNGLYNLDGYTSNASGMDSQPSDGYIALKSDGDKVTINQGSLSGWLYVWDHNLEEDTIHETTTAWDASGGSQTFENHECNCRVCWCNLWGTRRDVNTYVIATGYDPALRLDGEYSLQVDAELAHDKDLSDNSASCTFSASGPPSGDSGSGGNATAPTPTPGLDAQTITAGTHHFSPATASDHLYALNVPPNLAWVRVTLHHPQVTAGNYDLYARRGSPPTPAMIDFDSANGDCISDQDGGYDDLCSWAPAQSGWYYLLVHHDWGSGPFDLTIEFGQRTPTLTPSVTPTETAGGLSNLSEVEGNGTRQNATPWSGEVPIEGRLATNGDLDFYRWTPARPGIYTLLLDNVPASIRADMYLYREDSTSAVLYNLTQPFGGPVSIQLDANAGQVFYIKIKATSTTEVSPQPYRLSLSTIADPHEPDDVYGNARAWDDLTVAQQGYFWEEVSGPDDYYRFTVPQSALVTLDLSGVDPAVRPDLAVYDSVPSSILYDYSAPAGGNVKLTFDANAGEVFYVKVRPTDRDQTATQPYTLTAALQPDPFEPDDTRGEARSWDYTAGAAQGYFWEVASGAGDYYRITTPDFSGARDLAVNLSEVDAAVQPDLFVYTASGQAIVYKTNAAAGESIHLVFSASGSSVYFIQVRPTSRTQTSGRPYQLSIAQVVR